MPIVKISPPVTSVSVEGVEFKADDKGLFQLPANPAIIDALKAAGMTVTKVDDAAEELGYISVAEARAANEAEKQALLDRIKELETAAAGISTGTVTPARPTGKKPAAETAPPATPEPAPAA